MASWKTSDDRAPQATPARRGFGIRSKLFVAFGAVAGLTVLASAVAVLSYEDMGRTLDGIAGKNLPAMSQSLRLAKSSAEIVEQRLVVRDARVATDARVRAAHAAIATALAPLVDDAAFDLAMDLEKAGDIAEARAMKKHMTELADTRLSALQAMFDLRADSNLALGLLTEAANIPSKELLPPLRDRFG